MQDNTTLEQVNKGLEKIQVLFDNTCKTTFGEPKQNTKVKTNKDRKPWFTKSCNVMRNKYHLAKKII